MPVTATSPFSSAHAGTVNDAGATAASNQVNEFLGTHPSSVVYLGTSILTPKGNGLIPWAQQFSTQDVDQPFTLATGTSIGRVVIPLLPVGNGADLLVSLCADNSGAPGTLIAQTRVPASWISQLSVASGLHAPSTQSPVVNFTNNPLALAQFYSFAITAPVSAPMSIPAASDGSYIQAFNILSAPNYIILLGGQSSGTSAGINSVYTYAYDENGNLGQPVPQPSMPTVVYGSAGVGIQIDPTSGAQTIIVAGGATTSIGTPLNTVYTASFDPTTGNVSSWSVQTPLPTPVNQVALVTNGSYVYVLGGYTTGTTAVSTVYYAQVQNGQITSWNTAMPLPTASLNETATAVAGLMFIGPGGATGTTYSYAAINANGSLGPWQLCPPFNQIVENFTVGNLGIFTGAGPTVISVTPDGPDYSWQVASLFSLGQPLSVSNGVNGKWQGYSLVSLSPGTYATYQIYVTPRISVPLPATGLTNGATYHILMQQQGGDATDYLVTHLDIAPFAGATITGQTSNRNNYSWTALTSTYGVPLQIFDQTAVGSPLHAWDDHGARISTLVYATTPDSRLLGYCGATRTGAGLNQNQGFEYGVSPWTVTGGALTQSSTQAFEGTYAAKIVPNGSTGTVFIQSEMLPCLPGQSITVTGWMWFTNAVTSNASLSVQWFSATGAGGGSISTSSTLISVAATSWAFVSNTFTAPSGAYQFAIEPSLSGTPSSSQIWYVDNTIATYTSNGAQVSDVSMVNYGGTYISGSTYPPLGVTQLA